MEGLLQALQFQCDAFRDLCSPALLPLLQQAASLVDELMSLVKHGGVSSISTAALLQRPLGLLSGLLLLHSDLHGLALLFTARLRQQQLAGVKRSLAEVRPAQNKCRTRA